MDLASSTFPEHAAEQMARRQISEVAVRRILLAPEHVQKVRAGRVVAQGMIDRHLLREFVDVDRSPPEVVTAYRTSQLKKYRVLP